ncbi:CRISPR type III-A/MTUBE-associated RAMP protein Csm4 [Aedoeadaptatus ivorii]|uniref:CRISPR system Cms protein Csm4 n=1 Tax=Aedoeadaptatus ivorii TaxID=54006 RepID=A0A448V041_9FIRM|nr:type III-A CRISPR-associated RAMP protein Csm4 [Peptoniphilus ivorii]VEJ34619.1 CRISPR type III-A/MTUBE-associated RAMP protein Csm4 [Peptoniphilus ivorii]
MKALQTVVYRLIFPNGIHLGGNKLSDAESTLRADTLFSALCHEAQKIQVDGIEKLVALIREGLRFSDAFPFDREELFLPKPMVSIRGEDRDSSQKKKYKKIDYIPLSEWSEYIAGNSDPDDILDVLEETRHQTVYTKILHRPVGDHEIYNLGVRYFPENAGLYFIMRCPESRLGCMDELLYSLSYSGIGGKRKSGFGRFEIASADTEVPVDLKNLLTGSWNSWMSLTTSLPGREEGEKVVDGALGYEVIRRGGFIASADAKGNFRKPVRKRDIYFLRSGSVFRDRYRGELYDVSPGYGHPVYRYGMPIFVGVKS